MAQHEGRSSNTVNRPDRSCSLGNTVTPSMVNELQRFRKIMRIAGNDVVMFSNPNQLVNTLFGIYAVESLTPDRSESRGRNSLRIVAGIGRSPCFEPATIFTSTMTSTAFSAWYGTSKRTFVVVGNGEMLPNVSKGYDQTR